MLSIKPGLHTLHSPREQAVVRALADEAIASRGAPGAIAQLRELGAAKGGATEKAALSNSHLENTALAHPNASLTIQHRRGLG
jgi:hypothetical protein